MGSGTIGRLEAFWKVHLNGSRGLRQCLHSCHTVRVDQWDAIPPEFVDFDRSTQRRPLTETGGACTAQKLCATADFATW